MKKLKGCIFSLILVMVSVFNVLAVSAAAMPAAAPVVQIDPYAEVKKIYGVNNDYEAFKKLRYEECAQFAGNEVATYNYYLTTTGGQQDKYLRIFADYLVSIYGAHVYNNNYDRLGNGTHMAYCQCHAWHIENCQIVMEPNGSDRHCVLCGQKYVWGGEY